MKKEWSFLPAQLLITDEFTLKESLLDYDGPQIAIFTRKSDGFDFLGVAVDEEMETVRWILAPCSSTELTAIKMGIAFLRDAFYKSMIIVLDFNLEGLVISAWEIASEILKSEHLPNPRVTLPIPTEAAYSDPNRIIKLDGKLFKKHSIAIRKLADIFYFTQRVLDRIAEVEVFKFSKDYIIKDIHAASCLNLSATAPGSFELNIEPSDEKFFEHINAKFMNIIMASNDLGLLREKLNLYGSRTKSAYSEFLTAVHTTGLELLFLDSKNPVYLSPGTAENIKKTISENKHLFKNTFLSFGYFYAYRSKNKTHTFEFFDEVRGESYKGNVSSKVWKYTSVQIGQSVKYKVKISETDISKGDLIREKKYKLEEVMPGENPEDY